jgi:hypothetical protein
MIVKVGRRCCRNGGRSCNNEVDDISDIRHKMGFYCNGIQIGLSLWLHEKPPSEPVSAMLDNDNKDLRRVVETAVANALPAANTEAFVHL